MKAFILAALVVLTVGTAYAQTCAPAFQPPSAPPPLVGGSMSPPTAQLPDGGYTGCQITPAVPAGQPHSIGDAKCTTAEKLFLQAAAIDVGWGDGGVP